MPKRRGHGEGALYKRKDAKGRTRWCAEVYIGVDAEGKRQVLRFSSLKQDEVSKWLTKTLNELHLGRAVWNSRESVGDFLDDWIAGKGNLSERVRLDYERIIRRHIKPAIGRIRLSRLAPADVRRLYAAKEHEGLSPSRVRQIHAVLRKALADAEKWGKVGRNAAALVDAPKVPDREMQALDVHQARAFVAAVKGDPLEALYILALTTGMRQGELLGLKWSAIDWHNSLLSVQRSLARVTGKGLVLKENKTKKSRRAVELSPFALDALRRHAERQDALHREAGASWQQTGLVFTNARGGALDPSNLLDRHYALLWAAGLPRIRFHDLRHSAASILLAMGVNPKHVQELLGHTRISTTLDIYSHVQRPSHREAVLQLSDLLAQPPTNIPSYSVMPTEMESAPEVGGGQVGKKGPKRAQTGQKPRKKAPNRGLSGALVEGAGFEPA